MTSPFPEAALRAALTAAVAAWASRDEGNAGDEPRRRVYVDAFAGAELQFGGGVKRDAAEPTRAEAALRALDGACAGPAPHPVALFVEEDPAHLQRIYGDLEDAAGERLRATRDFASLAPGEASLVEAPFAAVAADVAKLVAGARAFVWLAPSSARALPWEALRPLVALPDATLLIRFPHVDFEKQSAHTGPLADLPGFARRIVEGCSAFLGDAKHSWLPAWRAAPGEGLELVLARFQALLESAARDRVVRPIALVEDGARAWLFLVTSDASINAPPEVGIVEEPSVEAEEAEEVEEIQKVGRPAVVEESTPVAEPEPPATEVLDLFPEIVATPPPPRAPAPPKQRRPKLAPDDGFFGDDN